MKKHTHLSHAERKNNIGETRLLTHAHRNSKAAAGIDHGELIAIDGDEKAKYGNSSDRVKAVGAGGGACDENINLSRCVFATEIYMFGTGDTAIAGDGNADGSPANLDVGLRSRAELPRY